MNKNQFESLIINTLIDHPDWLNVAVRAIHEGLQQHIEKLNEQYANLDAAFLSALGLCKKERLSKAVVEHLNNTIVDKLKKQSHKSKLEEDFLAESPINSLE